MCLLHFNVKFTFYTALYYSFTKYRKSPQLFFLLTGNFKKSLVSFWTSNSLVFFQMLSKASASSYSECLQETIQEAENCWETPIEISTPALKQKMVISCSYSLASFPIVAREAHRSQQRCHELPMAGFVYDYSIFNLTVRHFDGNPEPIGICMINQTCED